MYSVERVAKVGQACGRRAERVVSADAIFAAAGPRAVGCADRTLVDADDAEPHTLSTLACKRQGSLRRLARGQPARFRAHAAAAGRTLAHCTSRTRTPMRPCQWRRCSAGHATRLRGRRRRQRAGEKLDFMHASLRRELAHQLDREAQPHEVGVVVVELPCTAALPKRR